MQNLLSSGSLPADAQQSRDLAQLQLGGQGAQIVEGGPQQPGNPQMQANKPRSITDIERLILDKQLISPRGVQVTYQPYASVAVTFRVPVVGAQQCPLSFETYCRTGISYPVVIRDNISKPHLQGRS